MKVTVEVDDTLLNDAMLASGLPNHVETVREALRLMLEAEHRQQLLVGMREPGASAEDKRQAIENMSGMG